MRHLTIVSLLTLLGCDSIGALKEPPVLTVTSPQRSLIQNHTGPITVTGTASASASGSPVKQVMVNNVAAMVNADGTFTATITVPAGATLIHTEAVSAEGGKATDTRSVEAGELRPQGANIERAVTTAVSKEAFAKIAGVATSMIKTTDFKPILTTMNPVAHSGDENGEDCLFGRVFVDDVKLTDANITLAPVAGGLKFSASITKLNVPGRVRWAFSCSSHTNDMLVTADAVRVAGTLVVTPDGTKGFKADIASPQVQFDNLVIKCEGVPDWMSSMIASGIEYAVPKLAGRFMGPMLNKALGGLDGPQQLDVLGKKITVQVAPADITFTPEQGVVTLDMKMLIAGTETSKGFIYTDNGMPAMDAGAGMQIGLADDLANELLSQVAATGMLNLSIAAHAGTFDGTQLAMTSPPMVSADPADGKMRVILPDVMATFTLQGAPVGKAALNVSIDLAIEPANSGYGVAIKLGERHIYVDVLDDVENRTLLTDDDLGLAVELALDSQIASISALLGGIPLPAMAGMQMRNVSVGSDDGYVMMNGELE